MRRTLLWLPLGVFVLFLAVFLYRLGAEQDSKIRSRMVGKPVPDFVLEPALSGRQGFSASDLRAGGPRLVNIFASWCVPCATEAPQLLALKKRGVPIDAIAIRDTPQDLARFLQRHGDPFERIGDDPASKVQFAFGSSGVPETFVVDGRGIVRHQHIGEIRPADLDQILSAFEAAR